MLTDPPKPIDIHLKHGLMFNDGDKIVECLCGFTAPYSEAEEWGFDSLERGRRADVARAMYALDI